MENEIKDFNVGMKVSVFVVPCHSELDEVQKVLAAVTNSAGLVAVAVTGDTPGRRMNIRETHEGKIIE